MTRSWRNTLLLFIAVSLLVEAPALASNRYLTYQGRIKKLTGEPLEESSVRFRFEITNPTGTRVIYQEISAPINMKNSEGVFDIAIGSGAATVADGSINIETTFQNERSFNCVGGGFYSAVNGHSRLLRVSFLDSEGNHYDNTGGWTHTSDRRLKTEIQRLNRGLASILELKPVSYQYSLDPKHTQQIGFIAQDVEKIFPEVVVDGSDGYKSMIYANLVAPIVKAPQELAFIVENKAERSEVEALKAENAAMKEYLCSKDAQAPFCKK